MYKKKINVAKIFVLILFKIEANQSERYRTEKRSIINTLLTDKFKQWVSYKRIYDVYKEANFNPKHVYKWTKNSLASMNMNQKDSPWIINTLALQPKKKKSYGRSGP